MPEPAQDPIVTTTTGQIRGTLIDGVHRFLGVPYAAPPIDSLRFAEPAPHQPWPGIRDALEQGASSPQRLRDFPGLDVNVIVGAGWRKGEDSLNANIWVSAPSTGKAPVMVFLHGGAFVLGGNDALVTDGSAFARSGILCIAINYRLGIEGFLPIPGAPTNLGLRDQLFALHWVQANAAAFGGDPANVTVFGESAGAMSVACLLASPLASGLFRRAIIQSGHGSMVRPPHLAAKLTRKLAKILRISPDVAGFRQCSTEQFLDAQDKISKPSLFPIDLRDEHGREPAYGLSRFLPVTGDDVLPQPPLEALASGVGSSVDLLIGTNRDEINLYMVPTGLSRKINSLFARFLLRRVEPNGTRLLRAYGLGQKGQRAGEVFTRTLTDLVFRLPARQFAAAHRGHTHVYELDWRSPAFGGALGACHGLELPFVFNTLSTCSGPRGLAGEAPPQALADHVHALWVAFATNSSLPWPEYSAANPQVYALEAARSAAEPPMPAASIIRD